MSEVDKISLIKCNSCGKIHHTSETAIRKYCSYNKANNDYCDEWCFKWRYVSTDLWPGRYDRPLLFARIKK